MIKTALQYSLQTPVGRTVVKQCKRERCWCFYNLQHATKISIGVNDEYINCYKLYNEKHDKINGKHNSSTHRSTTGSSDISIDSNRVRHKQYTVHQPTSNKASDVYDIAERYTFLL